MPYTNSDVRCGWVMQTFVCHQDQACCVRDGEGRNGQSSTWLCWFVPDGTTHLACCPMGSGLVCPLDLENGKTQGRKALGTGAMCKAM